MSTTPAKLSKSIKTAVRFGSREGRVSKPTAADKPTAPGAGSSLT